LSLTSINFHVIIKSIQKYSQYNFKITIVKINKFIINNNLELRDIMIFILLTFWHFFYFIMIYN